VAGDGKGLEGVGNRSILTSAFGDRLARSFKHKETEEAEKDSLLSLSRRLARSSFAPGRINLDTPSVSFSSLKLMIRPSGISRNPCELQWQRDHIVSQSRCLGKQRVHGSSFAQGGNKVDGEYRASTKAVSPLAPFSPGAPGEAWWVLLVERY
jgi:hypothetical protein